MSLSQPRRLDVEGEVILGEEVGSFSGGTVRVFLEDISRADASSQRVAEQTIPNVSHEAGSKSRLPFRLQGDRTDTHLNYTVRVHVDLQGDGEIHVGDYITMQTYPVCSDEDSDQVFPAVREVK